MNLRLLRKTTATTTWLSMYWRICRAQRTDIQGESHCVCHVLHQSSAKLRKERILPVLLWVNCTGISRLLDSLKDKFGPICWANRFQIKNQCFHKQSRDSLQVIQTSRNLLSKIKEPVESIHQNSIKMPTQTLGVLICYCINTWKILEIWWEKAEEGYLNFLS